MKFDSGASFKIMPQLENFSGYGPVETMIDYHQASHPLNRAFPFFFITNRMKEKLLIFTHQSFSVLFSNILMVSPLIISKFYFLVEFLVKTVVQISIGEMDCGMMREKIYKINLQISLSGFFCHRKKDGTNN